MSWKDYVDDERALRRATERELMDTRAERDSAIAERDRLRDRVKAVLEAVRAQLGREAELAEALPDDEAVAHEYAHAMLEEMIAALTQALEEGS